MKRQERLPQSSFSLTILEILLQKVNESQIFIKKVDFYKEFRNLCQDRQICPQRKWFKKATSCFCIDPLGKELRNIWWINSILCSMGVIKKIKSHYEMFQFSVNECQILYNKSQKVSFQEVPHSFSVGPLVVQTKCI